MSDINEFESLADWMGEQDWTVNVRDYTVEYVTHVREQPVELLAERLMQSSWLAEHDAKVRAEALRDAAAWIEGTAAHDGLMYREFNDGEEVAESIPDALRVRADRIEREEQDRG